MRPPAVFAFEDDGSVHLYGELERALTQYEGVDVEDGSFQFFDGRGRPLEPVFIAPNRRGTLFGFRWLFWVESGVFRLEPRKTEGEGAFVRKLAEVSHMAPNPWFSSLEHLREHWRSAGKLGGSAGET